MKPFNYLFATAFLAVALVQSCAVREIEAPDLLLARFETFYASTETAVDTKVYADQQLRVLWNANDLISVYNLNTLNQQYRFDGADGDNSGTFTKVDGASSLTGNALQHIYATYPYAAANSISNDGVLSVTIPSIQQYSEGTFAPGLNVMVSATDNQYLKFKNVCGILAVKLYGAGLSVSSIELNGNKGEALAGKATVTIAPDGDPATNLSAGAGKSVKLVCSPAVDLPSSADEYKEFWFMLPPVTFNEGFTITVTCQDGTFIKTTNKKVTVSRNTITRMAPVKSQPPVNLSLNVVPEFQQDGEDALDYYMIQYDIKKPGNRWEGVSDDGAYAIVPDKNESVYGGSASFSAGMTSALFDYSPASFLFSNFSVFNLSGSNANSSSLWVPSVNNIVQTGAGRFRVDYYVANAHYLLTDTSPHLTLTVHEDVSDNDISSSPVLMVPKLLVPSAFAFTGRSYRGLPSANYSLTDELFYTASDAVLSEPSVKIRHTDTINLNELVLLHLCEVDKSTSEIDYSNPRAMTLADFQTRFPGYNVSFELVPYTMGNNATPQNLYGYIYNDNASWFFSPGYPDNGGSVHQIYDSSEGLSAVGKKPVVMVKLINPIGKLALIGYFKIQLMPEVFDVPDPGAGSGSADPGVAPEPQINTIILKDFSNMPVFPALNSTLETTWVDMSFSLLETVLRIPYEEFRNQYYLDDNTYYLNQSTGAMISSTQYGTVQYIPDEPLSYACNDIFRITVSPEQSLALRNLSGRTVTLYKHFSSYTRSEDLYIGFKIKLDNDPVCSFGYRDPKCWYSDVNPSSTSTIRNYGPTRQDYGSFNNGGDIISRYDFPICSAFTNSAPGIVVQSGYVDLTKVGIEFEFYYNQPSINGVRLQVRNNGKSLAYKGTTIAQFSDSQPDLILLSDNETTRELLSSFSPEATNVAQMFFFNVTMRAIYHYSDTGYTTLCAENLYVRYMPPIIFYINPSQSLDQNWLSVCLWNIFEVYDNKSNLVFKFNPETGLISIPQYNGVRLDSYYGFDTFSADLGAVTVRDAQNSFSGALSTYYPEASVCMQNVNTGTVMTNPSISLNGKINVLQDYILTLTPTGINEDVILSIPVSISYGLGTFSAILNIPYQVS